MTSFRLLGFLIALSCWVFKALVKPGFLIYGSIQCLIFFLVNEKQSAIYANPVVASVHEIPQSVMKIVLDRTWLGVGFHVATSQKIPNRVSNVVKNYNYGNLIRYFLEFYSKIGIQIVPTFY